jgi:hypothetical protein
LYGRQRPASADRARIVQRVSSITVPVAISRAGLLSLREGCR